MAGPAIIDLVSIGTLGAVRALTRSRLNPKAREADSSMTRSRRFWNGTTNGRLFSWDEQGASDLAVRAFGAGAIEARAIREALSSVLDAVGAPVTHDRKRAAELVAGPSGLD